VYEASVSNQPEKHIGLGQDVEAIQQPKLISE
jgi:hypothetical protein